MRRSSAEVAGAKALVSPLFVRLVDRERFAVYDSSRCAFSRAGMCFS
jgi:hypothetical protein